MKINRNIAALGGVGLLAASLFAAAPAMASTTTPAAALSCSKPLPITPSKTTNSKVKYSASGTCSSAYELAVRLYHYYAPPFPDPIVKESDDYTSPYSAGSSTCDGGGSTTYYTQGSFYIEGSGDVVQNSPNITINNHC